MSRQAAMPVAFAGLLTLAAGLSLAEEARTPSAAPGRPAASSSNCQRQGTPGDRKAIHERGGRAQTDHKSGVGSRALQGRAADQQETMTGVNRKGPRASFPPADARVAGARNPCAP